MSKKVSVIGAGNVGATCAFLVAQKDLADVVLVDILEGVPQGKALDMAQASSLEGFNSKVVGTNDYSRIKDSDVVVITAGLARKPGMSREDLLLKNAQIIKEVSLKIAEYAPNPIILMVSNPLDVMTYLAYHVSGFPAHRVLGQAGVLDSARFRYFVAEELGISIKDVSAMVLGGHGDSMVPLPRYTTVSGVSILELLPMEKIERIIERTRNGGSEIVSLLKTGSAFYSPASSACFMTEAILKDHKQILPASAYLDGQYGIKDLYIGVPVKLGRNGVEEIVELPLKDEELSLLQSSAKIYKEALNKIIGL
ncbi:malate dehydrogenase [bacterium]|nr:malate dehydrogenase [bacterium]MBU1615305.1 malate dehydrogenase [bacterium]